MANPPRYPNADGEDTSDSKGNVEPVFATTPAPRWVKVFGIIALVVALLVVILLVTGGGGHGPGRHSGGSESPSSNNAP